MENSTGSAISTSFSYLVSGRSLEPDREASPSRVVRMTPSVSSLPTQVPSPIATAKEVILVRTAIIPTDLPTQTADLSLTPLPAVSQTLKVTSTPVGTCGHSLDVPFGGDVKFVIHRISRGENLNLYALKYETSTDAIVAVNHHLPMPVWEDWILVIPVDIMYVYDLPQFEPYQAIGASLSLEELAQQLNTDPQSLSEYNAFEGPCKVFSGWLVIPRKTRNP